MYVFKKTLTRAVALVASFGLLGGMIGGVIAPSVAAADALNPLTDRSLTLSSSSPGWSYTDGSDNPWDESCFDSTAKTSLLTDCDPGYSPYGSPNSGANGQKTGETFSFNVSTNNYAGGSTPAHIKAMTFQYCTTPAGLCLAPGDDAYVGSSGAYTRGADTSSTSDLNVVTNSPSEIDTSLVGTTAPTSPYYSNNDVVDSATGTTNRVPYPDDSEGNFVVLTKDVGDGTWSYSGGWTMTVTNDEDSSFSVANGTATGKNNYITLVNSSGIQMHSTGSIKVIFYATNDNYITNPGNDAFFVKINDYSDTAASDVIDGGVTVANVMNQSIQIETKVLETMDFSVGTVDPDTLSDADLQTALASGSAVQHGQCDPILTTLNPADEGTTNPSDFLLLGNQSAESSLSTSQAYGTYSYFRLSSNSTGGATVYYAGTTLTDTEGDQIAPIGTTAAAPHVGTPQFGLALDNGSSGPYAVNYDDYNGTYENGADGAPTGIDSSFTSDTSADTDVHDPQLAPLAPATAYGQGSGYFNATYAAAQSGGPSVNTEFAFDPNANNVPAVLASENTSVVDCVTGKVRYIANIAATTPAGIYTSKINYIASPQY